MDERSIQLAELEAARNITALKKVAKSLKIFKHSEYRKGDEIKLRRLCRETIDPTYLATAADDDASSTAESDSADANSATADSDDDIEAERATVHADISETSSEHDFEKDESAMIQSDTTDKSNGQDKSDDDDEDQSATVHKVSRASVLSHDTRVDQTTYHTHLHPARAKTNFEKFVTLVPKPVNTAVSILNNMKKEELKEAAKYLKLKKTFQMNKSQILERCIAEVTSLEEHRRIVRDTHGVPTTGETVTVPPTAAHRFAPSEASRGGLGLLPYSPHVIIAMPPGPLDDSRPTTASSSLTRLSNSFNSLLPEAMKAKDETLDSDAQDAGPETNTKNNEPTSDIYYLLSIGVLTSVLIGLITIHTDISSALSVSSIGTIATSDALVLKGFFNNRALRKANKENEILKDIEDLGNNPDVQMLSRLILHCPISPDVKHCNTCKNAGKPSCSDECPAREKESQISSLEGDGMLSLKVLRRDHLWVKERHMHRSKQSRLRISCSNAIYAFHRLWLKYNGTDRELFKKVIRDASASVRILHNLTRYDFSILHEEHVDNKSERAKDISASRLYHLAEHERCTAEFKSFIELVEFVMETQGTSAATNSCDLPPLPRIRAICRLCYVLAKMVPMTLRR
ncbi:hypothetical protein HDU89_000976 [Geranomyces variabilis]|nr:hypothetical protein HDU89_000976 [Geranomyces variabilis]